MNRIYAVCGFLFFLVMSGSAASAQAFRKGSLLISMSEGYTNASYTTANNNGYTASAAIANTTGANANTGNNNELTNKANIDGDRDPLTVEYGLSNHWGVGINLGGDILHVSPSKFYGFEAPGNRVKVITSEATADVHYHFFVTQHTDLSAFTSFGFANVNIKGNNGESAYQYNAGGFIARTGVEARYYFCRRFGMLGMFSVYSSSCSSKDVKDNTVGNNYSTGISGYALEFGICARLLK